MWLSLPCFLWLFNEIAGACASQLCPERERERGSDVLLRTMIERGQCKATRRER